MSEERTSWDETNLPRERAAGLLALADGLCLIGRLREGRDAGQFSIFNFLLRAAHEEVDAALGDPRRPLVVLMRAGVFRRHAWYVRVRWPEAGRPARLELPSPIDRGWEWWADVEEIATRLSGEAVWEQALGMSWRERSAELEALLEGAELVKIHRG